MTKSYLSKVERGLSTPSIATALKLSKALNVKVEELFSEENVSLDSYSLVRCEDRQSLAANPGSAEYAVLAHQVSERTLLPFILYPRPNSPRTMRSRNTRAKSSCSFTKAKWKWTS